jgi:hypothetical protein
MINIIRMELTLVILLSMLGLNASPLKKVTRSTCPTNFSESRYWLRTETKRAAPPTGSCPLQLERSEKEFPWLYVINIVEVEDSEIGLGGRHHFGCFDSAVTRP